MGKWKQLLTLKNWRKIKRLIAQGQWSVLLHGVKRKLKSKPFKAKPAYSYHEIQTKRLRRNNAIESSMQGVTVDIIVPIYNGKPYLVKLFQGIEKTNMSYRLLLIDDASEDAATIEFIKEYAEQHENTELIRNARNMGFVGSVNRGLAMARNHVVLLNTDIELPNKWLERLIAPIVKDPTVASATPFTNSGTICSFPEFLKDNTIFNRLAVDQIDAFFKEIRSMYTTIPTGVGFCMAMNQKAIREVGLLDQKTFGKGYGEENDWCQRAIQKGFRNVMVENLYVYHNHGGTFTSEDKKELMKINQEKLAHKHPHYANLVGEYIDKDPMGAVRAYAFCRLTASLENNRYLIFHHTLGGGANQYIQNYAEKQRNEGAVTAVVQYQKQTECYQIEYQWKQYKILLTALTLEEVFHFAVRIDVNQVIVNQLVGYPHVEEHLQKIREFSEEHCLHLTAMLHDYYAICPSIYLLNHQSEFCHIPGSTECEACFQKNANCDNYELATIREWRGVWRSFLQACHEVRVFSQDSANLIQKAYGGLDQVRILPEQHTVMIPLEKQYKSTSVLTVGLIGTLTELKGARFVERMLDIAEERKLSVRFVLCGSSPNRIRHSGYYETGAYRPEMLPRLVLENDIDLFFISSICPETFSYTTQEVIEMGIPVACLPLGAPVERILRYEKGLVLSEPSPEQNLKELIQFGQQWKKDSRQQAQKKVLFLIEETSYASRYRVEHLQEQLLKYGISSDCAEVSEYRKREGYTCIVLYRCEISGKIKKILAWAKGRGIAVWYGIDDLVFDFQQIKELDFLKQKEYQNFPERCEKVHDCMKACDGILVSTNTLKRKAEQEFPDKPVIVQRNVASYEMVVLSQQALQKKEKTKAEKELWLGYFSGSNTHNQDFAVIEEVIIDILKQNPHVHLKIVGALMLSETFEPVKNQIKQCAFQPWQELPKMLSEVDINLMPLQKTVFHACKSENKWLEASLVKVPTIASYNEELAGVIEAGETGILCDSEAEWKQALMLLIQEEAVRSDMGEKAYTKVMKYHTTKELAEPVKSIFD